MIYSGIYLINSVLDNNNEVVTIQSVMTPTFADIDGSDEYLKEKLGFNANTEIITILEYAVLIYQESSGIELKFSPNQEFLTVIK